MAPAIPIAHDLDAGWVIALWIAIHGGDPARSEVTIDDEATLLVAAALDRQLATLTGLRERQMSDTLLNRLKGFGIVPIAAHDERPSFHCWQVEIFDVETGKPSGRYRTVCVDFAKIRAR
jgi:hypothetical protein